MRGISAGMTASGLGRLQILYPDDELSYAHVCSEMFWRPYLRTSLELKQTFQNPYKSVVSNLDLILPVLFHVASHSYRSLRAGARNLKCKTSGRRTAVSAAIFLPIVCHRL